MDDLLELYCWSPDLPVQPYVVDRTVTLVAIGRLRAGDRLPGAKRLALRLHVTPFTVHQAYRELQTRGVLTSADRSGSFIAVGSSALSIAAAHELSRAIQCCRELGIDGLGTTTLFTQQLERHFYDEKKRKPQVASRRHRRQSE